MYLAPHRELIRMVQQTETTEADAMHAHHSMRWRAREGEEVWPQQTTSTDSYRYSTMPSPSATGVHTEYMACAHSNIHHPRTPLYGATHQSSLPPCLALPCLALPCLTMERTRLLVTMQPVVALHQLPNPSLITCVGYQSLSRSSVAAA
jgi:hypothetical protein